MKNKKNQWLGWIVPAVFLIIAVVLFIMRHIAWGIAFTVAAIIAGAIVFIVRRNKKNGKTTKGNGNASKAGTKAAIIATIIAVLLLAAAIWFAILVFTKPLNHLWALIPAGYVLLLAFTIAKISKATWPLSLAITFTVAALIATIYVTCSYLWWGLVPAIVLCVALIWLVGCIKGSFCWIPSIVLAMVLVLLAVWLMLGRGECNVGESNHEHNYTSEVTKEATCKEEGTLTYTCECGCSYTETITKLDHKYESKVIDPTATEKGYTEYTCKICGDSYKDNYTDVTHTHSYSDKVTKKATCKEEGIRTYTCECGDSFTRAIAKTEHEYESKVIDPTATEKGYTLYTCKICGHSYKGNYTDKLPQSKNPTISVSTDYMVKGDTVTITLTDADVDDVVIKYVNPDNGAWVTGGASLKSMGGGKYRLIVDDKLWTMSVDLTIGLKGDNNYKIVTLEPCYE